MSDRYKDAGVDIDAGHRAVSLMKQAVEATHGPRVLGSLGAFGGLFDAAWMRDLEAPLLVSSADGVGTKTKVASAVGRYDTVGQDIVNHCVDDILVQGAEPLFFLDYVAANRLDPQMIATIVGGAAKACGENGCALLGGETAEMPGVYAEGEFDLVGTIVGVVDRPKLIDGSGIRPGMVVLGLPSAGLHTNGFTLARAALDGLDLDAVRDDLGGISLADALLAPHRSYLPEVRALWAADVRIEGLAHITGGGLVDNPPRILPEGTALHLDRSTWALPPVFQLIQSRGEVSDAEMARVFNCGLGMLVVVRADDEGRARDALAAIGTAAPAVGRIAARDGAPVVFDR